MIVAYVLLVIGVFGVSSALFVLFRTNGLVKPKLLIPAVLVILINLTALMRFVVSFQFPYSMPDFYGSFHSSFWDLLPIISIIINLAAIFLFSLHASVTGCWRTLIPMAAAAVSLILLPFVINDTIGVIIGLTSMLSVCSCAALWYYAKDVNGTYSAKTYTRKNA